MDVGTIRIVVCALFGICALAVGGIVFAQANGRDVHPELVKIAWASASAIIGILIVPRLPPQPPQQPDPR